MSKVCTKCNFSKNYDNFHKHKSGKNGLRSICKECDAIKTSLYQQNNREKYNSYMRMRRASDLQFKLAANLRHRLNASLKRKVKIGSAVKNLGCTLDFFKNHIETQFQPGMTWTNYGNGRGKWNLDHIFPLTSFDLTNEKDFLTACHSRTCRHGPPAVH